MTYSQAKRAIELYESEYVGQDPAKLWAWAVETAINESK